MPAESTEHHVLHLTDPEVLACPYGYYAQLHEFSAAARDEGPIGWTIAGHAVLSQLSRDTARFTAELFGPDGTKLLGTSPEPPPSPEVMALVAKMRPMANALVIGDPPAHGRQKAIINKWLNGTHIKTMEPLIREVVDRTIDSWIDHGQCEFVAQFAIPVPLTMIAHALGVDQSDLARFKVWTDHLEMGYMEPLNNEQRLAVATSVLEFQDYIVEQIADRRANPTDDLLSALVNATLVGDEVELEGGSGAGPDRLSEAEILTMTSQLLAAGNVTTTSLIADVMVALIENPEAMAAVRADPALIDAAIDESLRRDAPIRGGWRVTKQDVELENVTVPAGSVVLFAYGAAGHDPEVFPEPATFDIRRPNVSRHFAFGHGPHFCVGSHLARTEARIAFERLLDRVTDLRLLEGTPADPIVCVALHGFREVNLTFSKAS